MANDNARLLGYTSDIVSSYATGNRLDGDVLPGLIKSVYQTLASTDKPAIEVPAEHVPAVPIKKSVYPDHIVCLEDGRKLKMLKRHLKTSYGMSPEAYRAKWSLPHDYPMVAPNYAIKRSQLAKAIGLGRKAPVDVPVVAAATVAKAGRRGRSAAA